jgi:plasmid replication initiation protein
LGVYSVRVYELLKQYETIGHRLLGFDEMKKMFELENEYPEFANFFRRVIEPSLKEINEFTDIYVHNVEKLKEGKKITAMRFHFRKNPNKITANEPQQTLILNAPTETTDISFKEKTKPTKEKILKNDERFTIFYTRVVENLGVTPSVLMDLLKEYSDEQFDQAIRVTNRAKIDGQIKTNPSGFFVQALKNGYTDQKEERLKKEKKEAVAKRIADQIAALEVEKDSKIFDRLKVLTSNNPTLTEEAIAVLKQSEEMQTIIMEEEENQGRPLEINDYRQHPTLRIGVINTIISQNMEQFADIILEYDTKINELKMSDAF